MPPKTSTASAIRWSSVATTDGVHGVGGARIHVLDHRASADVGQRFSGNRVDSSGRG
jgi:hypothetical protein